MSARALPLGPVLAALLASLAACGDDTGGAAGGGQGGDGQGGGDQASTTTGAGGDDAATSTGAGASAACPFPDDDPSAAAPIAVTSVEGVVLTTDGDPVSGSEVQVCGRDLCLYGETEGDGAFIVTHTGEELDKPIVKAGDGLEMAKFGFAFPAEGESVAATVPVLSDSGTPLAAGAVAEAAGVQLTVPDDGAVALNLLDYSGAGEDTLRAAIVPVDQTDAVAPGEGFDLVIGLGPYETRFCPPAALEVANDAGLEPGTAVEFLLYGLQIGEGFVPYGEWAKVADGVVSDDGEVITTNDGEGIPVLGPVAIRVAN